MNKSELRAHMKNILVDTRQLIIEQSILLEKLANELSIRKPQCIGLFAALPGEIDVSSIMMETKAIVSYPRVCDDKLIFHKVRDLHELTVSQPYGIYEPSFNAEIVIPDLILVPGLAFASGGTRLGRGKGYYDKYLSKNNCFTISLAFSWQLLPYIPKESHDVRINLVITTNDFKPPI